MNMKMAKKDNNQPIADPLAEIVKLTQQDQKAILEENFWPIAYLPSKYKLYPSGSKLFARPLNVREVKQLATINDSNLDYILNEVIRKATYGIDVEELLIEDKLFVIFWLRENTYKDSGFTLDFICPHCSFKNNFEFDINKLDVIDLRDDFDEDFELTLKKSQDRVKVKFLRVKDETRVATFKSKNRNSLMNFDDEFLNVANLIREINGEPSTSLLNNYNYVDKLHPVDFAYLLSYISHVKFGVNPILNTTCTSCGGEAPVGVTFQPEFFIPTYKFE